MKAWFVAIGLCVACVATLPIVENLETTQQEQEVILSSTRELKRDKRVLSHAALATAAAVGAGAVGAAVIGIGVFGVGAATGAFVAHKKSQARNQMDYSQHYTPYSESHYYPNYYGYEETEGTPW